MRGLLVAAVGKPKRWRPRPFTVRDCIGLAEAPGEDIPDGLLAHPPAVTGDEEGSPRAEVLHLPQVPVESLGGGLAER
jgi:hypothetical protein